MSKYYVVKEEDNSTGCLIAIIFAVIALIVVAYLAMYVLGILLAIILFASVLMGAGLTLKNYFMALRDSVSLYAHEPKPDRWFLPTFFYRWFKVSWESLKGAWVYNIESIKEFFNKMGFYRLLSIRKWLYLFSALSVLVFGTGATLAILFFHLYLIVLALRILLVAFLAVCAIFALIGFGIALAVSVMNYISRLRESYYQSATIFSAYITQGGYRAYLDTVKEYCVEAIRYIKEGFSTFASLPWLSFRKWMNFGSALMTIFVAPVLLVVFAVVHVVVLSVLFVVFKLIGLFHR